MGVCVCACMCVCVCMFIFDTLVQPAHFNALRKSLQLDIKMIEVAFGMLRFRTTLLCKMTSV